MKLLAMEALKGPVFANGTIDFAFGRCRRNSHIYKNSKYNPRRNLGYFSGCRLFHSPSPAVSPTIKARSGLSPSFRIVAAFRRNNGVPRRRNALRPKLIEQGKVRESNLKLDNNIITVDEISLKENLSEGLEKISSEDSEEVSSEGLIEDAHTIPEREAKSSGSNFWDTLENWNIQYQKDVGYWGIGTAPILSVYENADGDVQSVSINEDEILLRSGIQPILAEYTDEAAMSTANIKIARARLLAREIETGILKPPRNSTVFKFVKPGKNQLQKWGEGLRSVLGQVGVVVGRAPFILKFSIAGFAAFYVCCFVWALRKYLFSDAPLEMKELDDKKKKMLLRKMKSRLEKERMDRNFVEKDGRVSDLKLPKGSPRMDDAESQKEVLAFTELYKGKPAMDETEVQKRTLATTFSKGKLPIDDAEFDRKIQKIRAMAREARKIEKQNHSDSNNIGRSADEVNGNANEVRDLNTEASVADAGSNGREKEFRPVDMSASAGSLVDNNDKKDRITADITVMKDEKLYLQNSILFGDLDVQNSSDSNNVGKNVEETGQETDDGSELDVLFSVIDSGSNSKAKESWPVDASALTGTFLNSNDKEDEITSTVITKEENLELGIKKFPNEIAGNNFVPTTENLDNVRNSSGNEQSQLDILHNESNFSTNAKERAGTGVTRIGQERKTWSEKHLNDLNRFSASSRKGPWRMKPRVITSIEEAREVLASKRSEAATNKSDYDEKHASLKELSRRIQKDDPEKQQETGDSPHNRDIFLPFNVHETTAEKQTKTNINGSLVEENYEKLRPAFKKFKVDSQKKVADAKSELEDKSDFDATVLIESAEDKAKRDNDGNKRDAGLLNESENDPGEGNNGVSGEEGEEFDWMRDDALREIVFKVHANEQAGRDPFDGLNSEEENLFFSGIKRQYVPQAEKVEKWIRERVENWDYGEDGIGLDDPPEACMARWKDANKTSASPILEKFKEDREKFIEEKMRLYNSAGPKVKRPVITKSTSTSTSSAASSLNSVTNTRCASHKDSSTSAGTVISSSGWSDKTAGRSPREYWKHTKKWSHAFQEMYDAEKDPDIKAVMRDLGQDLDRWITEEEVKEASEFLSKGPEEQLKYFEKIKARIERESEMFGREAMFSKYSEYKSEAEDHLWWLDLPYVLCIELYRNKDGKMMKGLYSLEMAPDLDSENKRYHAIAFQDRGDATNFCYILQSHLSKLENGTAHVIPRSPKELYREGKSEGFKVTVIKKRQLQLYIDQPLEEVEDKITEIGSAMYYDKILEDRVIDIDSVLKNGFGLGSLGHT